jgi:transcription-repair coupling factor (superfamily II helicase)
MSAHCELAADFLSRSRENGGIFGLKASAPSFLAALAVARGAGPLVVVVPSGDQIATVTGDIRFFSGRGAVEPYPLLDDVVAYPSPELPPYSFEGFQTEISMGRMAALCRLAEGSRPRVFVAAIDSLLTRTLPPDTFKKNNFIVSKGEEWDRDLLLHALDAAGYSRSPLVEDVGEFSVRGSVIDLYPPHYPAPVRIEQVGDLIESIRFFDPSNQRSKEEMSQVLVGVVHLIPREEADFEEGIDRFARACEDQGIEKPVRMRIIDDLRNGVRFPGFEHYLPFFHKRTATLMDYLPKASTLILPERDVMERAVGDFGEEVFHGWERARGSGLPVPSPERLYLSADELRARMERFRRVVVGDLGVEEPGATSIHCPTEANTDIRAELLQAKGYDAGMGGLVEKLSSWRDEGCEIFLVSRTRGQADRLDKLLAPYRLRVDVRGEMVEAARFAARPTPGIRLVVGDLSAGFRCPTQRIVFITEEEIFGARVRSVRKRRAAGSLIASLTDLSEGEAVVHEDYGIGVYRGLVRKEFEGVVGEVMKIEYAGGDILYVPVERLECVQKYVSGAEEPPRVDKLGGKGWAKTKAKVKGAIREMAKELLKIYAARQVASRPPYAPTDDAYAAFEAAFDYEETPDQLAAIQDIMEAMDTDKPMDRLVCGDVGYGKTEVALRAAFRALMDGRQVAILVPTTILAQQHYDTVTRRLQGYPFRIETLSRFRSSQEQKETVKGLEEGKVDLVVGTHRLLRKDIKFKDLGILVVDEEHRFGVAHKERIKKYRANVDVLTLTATPIPRTLNMALSGMRDLSLIDTPPSNRKAIRTHVAKQTDEVIREALLREVSRGGQVFYVHNRVRSIFRRAAALQQLVPEARFGVAHGQMAPGELEKVMTDFVAGKFNVLVSTNIVESGLDIPRANTIVIERADTFGLADLYQLRGRVGRSHVRAYAYLLTPPDSLMTPDAMKRLAVVQEYSDLGQGFRIAMRDMEIRGAGSILGSSQSGHVAQVGYEMYVELLEEAVQEMKGEEPKPRLDPEINLRLDALLPEAYVPDAQQRMNLYKRLSRAEENREIDDIRAEMVDRYGRAPREATNLIEIMRLRLSMKALGVIRLDYNGKDLVLGFHPSTPVNPETLILWARRDALRVRLLPEDRVKFRLGDVSTEERLRICAALLDSLEKGRVPTMGSDAKQKGATGASRARD